MKGVSYKKVMGVWVLIMWVFLGIFRSDILHAGKFIRYCLVVTI